MQWRDKPRRLTFRSSAFSHNGGDLTAGQGAVGLVGAGAVGEVALNNACGVQRLHIDVVGVREGLLIGEVGGGQLQPWMRSGRSEAG